MTPGDRLAAMRAVFMSRANPDRVMMEADHPAHERTETSLIADCVQSAQE